MRADSFVDTNVLLYAVSGVSAERRKRDAARALLARPGLGISVQVLQEFYVQATSSQRAAYHHEEVQPLLAWLRRLPLQAITLQVFDLALQTKDRYGISYWDAAIVAAAQELGCSVVYSEDLSHGQAYGAIRVQDPFQAAASGA